MDLKFLDSGKSKDIYIRRVYGVTVIVINSPRAKTIVSRKPDMMRFVYIAPVEIGLPWALVALSNTENKWFIWAMSHQLSFESDIPFNVKGTDTEFKMNIIPTN